MCLSIFFALVIGFYLFSVSLAMLVYQARFKKVVGELLSQPFMTLGGIWGTIFGLIIVVCHNRWVADWTVWITLVGWFTLIQGLARLFFPEHVAKAVRDLQAQIGYTLFSWFWLFVGAFLAWKGLQ